MLLLRRLATPAAAGARAFAKKAPAPAKGGAKVAESAAAANDLESVVRGLNILKDGQDPVVKPDSEYPDWVFTLHHKLPSLEELSTRYKEDPESLDTQEMRRLIRQWNRKRIKERNES